MRRVGTLTCSFLVILLGLCIALPEAKAQDKIFALDGRVIPSKISTIDKKISYRIFSNPTGPEYLIKAKEVAFIVYENGDLQVFDNKKQKYIPFEQEGFDLLLLATKNFLPVDAVEVHPNDITGYSLARETHPELSMARSSALALWDRGRGFLAIGSHGKIQEALLVVPPVGRVFKREGVRPATEVVNNSTIDDVFSSPVVQQEPVDQVGGPIFDNPVKFDINEENFKQKAVAKVERLTGYISVIADKATPSASANRAINEALVLFVSDTCIVQVSSVNRPNVNPREEYIRRYLQNLKSLLYDRVVIEWADINYVSDLKKDPSGNYYGIVSFLQRFQGFRDGQVAYSDRVTKNVTVWFKSYEKFENGIGEELWDVLLSDIMVEQTEAY